MANLERVTVTNSNKVNGGETDLLFTIKSQNPVKQSDVLTIELPPGVSFEKNVDCAPLPEFKQLKSISCSNS